MTAEDYQVAAACPTKPATILAFIGRTPYAEGDSRMSVRFGDGWEARLCSGDLLVDQPAEETEPNQLAAPKVEDVPPPDAPATGTPAIAQTVETPVRR